MITLRRNLEQLVEQAKKELRNEIREFDNLDEDKKMDLTTDRIADIMEREKWTTIVQKFTRSKENA